MKEKLRRLLAAGSLAEAEERFEDFAGTVSIASLPEADKLLATIRAWWPQIEVMVVTGVSNARTEAANTGIKHIKRTGRGFRNPGHYRGRILLSSTASTAE